MWFILLRRILTVVFVTRDVYIATIWELYKDWYAWVNIVVMHLYTVVMSISLFVIGFDF